VLPPPVVPRLAVQSRDVDAALVIKLRWMGH
jgi:hypothetical protein